MARERNATLANGIPAGIGESTLVGERLLDYSFRDYFFMRFVDGVVIVVEAVVVNVDVHIAGESRISAAVLVVRPVYGERDRPGRVVRI
jgi:hypothetical protein